MSDNAIFLRATNDNYHALKFDSVLGGVGLWGANGGYLGSTADGKTIKKAVEWYWDGNAGLTGGYLYTPASHIIQCAGTQHMFGPDNLYLLNKKGVIIGKEWGGTGTLSVQGALTVNDVINCKSINITG